MEEELERLFGASHVKPAMAELSKSGRGDDMDTIKISELVHGRHFKVVFLGSVLFALQQLSGINAVFYFSSTVFRSAGVSSDIGNICVGVIRKEGAFDLEFLGHGKSLAMGFQVIAASGFLQGSGNMYLSVAGMLLFVVTFSLGAGPVPGLLLSEIFPGRIRATAMAICMAVHWVINFFVGLLFLRLLEILGPQTLYTMFATVCLMAVAFVKKNVVETKGKSLQEIEVALLPVD
ncbi:putative plastidic glucose transporter 3 [Dorcoceras hygrometricum]|uniref:Putative plastidic glucose transporter 3 n=1 Tax=Dorcoceras hygrometricum TaxID=472368 RepID=A0A2Z7AYP0_9LAMI|nr:putative plastidic glucose transporter 3 [Dorcoceras hygrometricum]